MRDTWKPLNGRTFEISSVALAALSVLALWLWVKREPTNLRSANNAVWVQSLYYRGFQPTTKEPLKSTELRSLVRTLQQGGIRYAYMFAGPYEKDGHLPPYAFGETALSTTKQIRHLAPELVILPWVGGVVNRTVFPHDPAWVEHAIADTRRLVEVLEVPGVHVNFEFFTYNIPGEVFPGLNDFDSYGSDQIRFHQRLRAALPRSFISTVIESTAPQSFHWKRKNTAAEVAEMAGLVNQIAILCFDTSIKDKKRFRQALEIQLDEIRQWRSRTGAEHTQFLLGLGTFVNKPELWSFRDLNVESIANTLDTASALLDQPRSHPLDVDGLAIFADWTTSESQWWEIRRHWLAHK